MSPPRPELATNVGRLQDLDDQWLAQFHTVYLGDPFCHLLANNLLARRPHLAEAIQRVHALGGQAVVSTPVEPWTDDLPGIEGTVAAALDQGADGVEVLNFGVLHRVATLFPQAPIHVNGFVQAFNAQVLATLADWNVVRLTPYHELALDEIDRLRASGTVELELLIQGHIPLGYAEFCMIHPDRVAANRKCKGECYQPYWLRHRDLSLRAAGRMTASGRELCMLPHLEMLLQQGYRRFRIESRLRDTAYRTAMGTIYTAALARAVDSPAPDPEANAADLRSIEGLCPEGLCNGYYFGEPGMALR